MAAYTYSAINAEGLQLDGEVHAPDVEFGHDEPSAESHLYVLSTDPNEELSSAMASYLIAR